MKKTRFGWLALMLALVLALAACGDDAGASDIPEDDGQGDLIEEEPASSAAPEEEPAKEPAGEPAGEAFDFSGYEAGTYYETPEFLPEELQTLYWDAREVYLNNMGPGWPETPRIATYGEHPTLEVDGHQYDLADGEFTTLAQLTDYFYGVFTPEYADELMGGSLDFDRFVEAEGKLWFLWGDRGTHVERTDTPDQYEFVSGDADRVEFNVVGEYESWDQDTQETGDIYYEGYPIVMENTPSGWRVSTFNLTY